MVSINLQKSYMTSKLASIGSVILKSLRPLAIKGCCSKRQAASYGFGDWTVDFDYIAGTIYVRKSLNTATLNSKALLQRVITDTEARYLDTVLVLAVWRGPDPGVRISLHQSKCWTEWKLRLNALCGFTHKFHFLDQTIKVTNDFLIWFQASCRYDQARIVILICHTGKISDRMRRIVTEFVNVIHCNHY